MPNLNSHTTTNRISTFQTLTKLMGIGFIIFFLPVLFILYTPINEQLPNHPLGVLFLRLVRWGGVHAHGAHYEAMISIIYVVWGLFLYRAAQQHPSKNILFFDFTVVANFAHYGLMTTMAFTMPNEKIHLVGDLLLGWSSLAIFTLYWYSVRRILKTTPTS